MAACTSTATPHIHTTPHNPSYTPACYARAPPPPYIIQSQQTFTNRHLPRHMDGEGDAAALEYADEEAEADVEDGEDVSMGHQQRHHHLMRAQSHPPPHGEGEHQHQTQTNNTTTGTCATRVGMTSRSGTLAPRVTIANTGIRSVALDECGAIHHRGALRHHKRSAQGKPTC